MELAVEYRGASGLGLSQLAAKNGQQITTTTINAIRQGTYKYVPREGTLRALAWLAGVDASVAFMAAGQPVPGPPFAEELPPGVDNLSPKSRKIMIDLARVLVDLEKNADASNDEDQERPTDISSARERRDARPGQKTKRRLTAAEEQGDGNIPLPDNWQDLAAGAPHESQIKRDREWAERGEESQDQGE
ncbi:hypothetical protein AYX19_10000 [Paenarthrobacter ureafaciens]|nr:hypothetical protein AYX19_10000 [Paenarthrobacter ureafaciens]